MKVAGEYMNKAGHESSKYINRARQLAEEEINNLPKTGLGDLSEELAQQHIVKKQSENLLKTVEKLADPEPGLVMPDVKPTIASVTKMISAFNIPGVPKNTAPPPEPVAPPKPTSRMHKVGDAFLNASAEYGSLSNFATVLKSIGTAETEIGVASLAFKQQVNDDFIQPWSNVLNTDMKDLAAKENDLNYARLDLDSAKRRHRNASDPTKLAEAEADLRRAQIEFDRHYDSLQSALERLDRVQMEQTIMLRQAIEHQLAYHNKAGLVLEALLANMPTPEDVEMDNVRTHPNNAQMQMPE
ncbi:hypothetical protein, variant [Sphaeroforma arctica JP610]|nr:hypothetical protein, variant [Sphaeroforma arctica JP610]KNC77343.1 hypothetical protein, variant [Sphaeroforma arctica JP610]|eukprot:XP_014151245.1 hypothetical protein, variant [Sphaeroforma arctica JP610]